MGRRIDSLHVGRQHDLGHSGEDAPLFDDPIAEPVNFDRTVFESLFSAPLVTAPVSEENTLTQPITSTLGVVGILGGL